MADHGTTIQPGNRPVLDYFGKCPVCGYPAQASAHMTLNDIVIANCDRPCGWTGLMPLTTMTGRADR
ncbi:MAG: hypothetical protein J2P18_01680 [Nocardia sp.]|nr:hypothetical protein [Nocardia sp.]